MTPQLILLLTYFFAYLPPVVKYHAFSAARGLPALSLAPVVILAQYLLFASSLEAGFSVTVLEVIIRLRRFFKKPGFAIVGRANLTADHDLVAEIPQPR